MIQRKQIKNKPICEAGHKPIDTWLTKVCGAILLSLFLVCFGNCHSALAQTNTPTLANLSPNSTTAGSPAFTLTLTGANFNQSTIARWNGADQPTTYLSPNQLTAEISAINIAAPGIAKIAAFNPGAGGGLSNALTFTITQAASPKPTINSLSPNSATAGGHAFTLTVNGTNFNRNSTVKWNGVNQSTVVISATQLKAEISSLNITAPGTASVRVFNLESGSSNALPFTISQVNAPATPAPAISSINPGSAPAGSPGLSIAISGANFIESSIVRWNGAARATSFISANLLTASIQTSDLVSAGATSITVMNPAGGSSNALTFTITPVASPKPLLTRLTPGSIPAGNQRVQLMVNGMGFTASSIVELNGNSLRTTFVTPSQLFAIVPLSIAQTPGAVSITVVNPHGDHSNALPLSITAQPPTQPALASISASVLAQGARQAQMVLVGYNFKPGARVIISESAGSLAASTDIALESLSYINDKTMIAVVSVGDRAATSLRFVNVVNPDQSNTTTGGSNTAKPLRIASASSLAAPLAVRSLAITHPRSGTVAAQGEELFAEALLGGSGTGTVTGQWLLDGQVFEQFAVAMTGGERVTLKASQPLPTAMLGAHTLELRITSPGTLASPALQIVINPGDWRLLRLLAPATGAGFKSSAPPLLRWAMVAGAAKYQVGFSSKSSARTIKKWHDAGDTEWQVPKEIWSSLPEGELYWTVRVIESSGSPRQPAQMRRITKTSNDANVQTPGAAPGGAETSARLVQYQEGYATVADGLKTEKWESAVQQKAETGSTSSGNREASAEADSQAAPNTVASEAEAGASRLLNFEVASNTQMVSDGLAGTSVLSIAAQSSLHHKGFRVEMNGSGLLNLLIHPQPQHAIGQFNDYVFRVGYERKSWAADARFGIIAPQTFANAEFITLSVPRQAVEGTFRAPIGTFSLYTDANGRVSGEVGALAQKQALRAASYQAPLPAGRATFRLMWLGAEGANHNAPGGIDANNANAQLFDAFGAPMSGDASGAVFLLSLGKSWQWAWEYSQSANHLNTPLVDSFSGKAFRTGVSLNLQGMNLSLAYRDVSPNYAAPVNAAFAQMSASDRRGLDSAIMKQTPIGSFTANYQFLQSDLRSKDHPTTSLHHMTLGWAKEVTPTTTLAIGGNVALTTAGRSQEASPSGEMNNLQLNKTNQRRTGLNLSVMQRFGKLSLTAGGLRNWLEDRVNRRQSNQISSLNLSGNWNPNPLFQLQSNFSINWMVGDRFSAGRSRAVSTYIQPVLAWQRLGLQIIPLITVNQMSSHIGINFVTGDLLSMQYGGRVAWRMPGLLKINTLSIEASQSRTVDTINRGTVVAPRLLFLWTIVKANKSAS